MSDAQHCFNSVKYKSEMDSSVDNAVAEKTSENYLFVVLNVVFEIPLNCLISLDS